MSKTHDLILSTAMFVIAFGAGVFSIACGSFCDDPSWTPAARTMSGMFGGFLLLLGAYWCGPMMLDDFRDWWRDGDKP